MAELISEVFQFQTDYWRIHLHSNSCRYPTNVTPSQLFYAILLKISGHNFLWSTGRLQTKREMMTPQVTQMLVLKKEKKKWKSNWIGRTENCVLTPMSTSFLIFFKLGTWCYSKSKTRCKRAENGLCIPWFLGIWAPTFVPTGPKTSHLLLRIIAECSKRNGNLFQPAYDELIFFMNEWNFQYLHEMVHFMTSNYKISIESFAGSIFGVVLDLKPATNKWKSYSLQP